MHLYTFKCDDVKQLQEEIFIFQVLDYREPRAMMINAEEVVMTTGNRVGKIGRTVWKLEIFNPARRNALSP